MTSLILQEPVKEAYNINHDHLDCIELHSSFSWSSKFHFSTNIIFNGFLQDLSTNRNIHDTQTDNFN